MTSRSRTGGTSLIRAGRSSGQVLDKLVAARLVIDKPAELATYDLATDELKTVTS